MTRTGHRSRPGQHLRDASRGAVARIPRGIAGADDHRGRVAVVGASVGQGHDGAARSWRAHWPPRGSASPSTTTSTRSPPRRAWRCATSTPRPCCTCPPCSTGCSAGSSGPGRCGASPASRARWHGRRWPAGQRAPTSSSRPTRWPGRPWATCAATGWCPGRRSRTSPIRPRTCCGATRTSTPI